MNLRAVETLAPGAARKYLHGVELGLATFAQICANLESACLIPRPSTRRLYRSLALTLPRHRLQQLTSVAAGSGGRWSCC